MKKTTFLFFILFASIANAQIPNNGFEVWEDYIDNLDGCKPPFNVYQKPDFWVGSLPNKCETHSFSLEKVNESYPVGTGNYCVKVKADPANGVRGVIISNDKADTMKNWIPEPAFAINRKPASLFLYYKYLPYGGDTAVVQVYFYKKGQVIANTSWGSPETITNWTPLEIPLNYTTADVPDSVTILMTTGAYVQHSASVLYVDNLSFDGFVNSLPQVSVKRMFSLFPNPASDVVTLNSGNTSDENLILNIYDISGTLVKSTPLTGNQDVSVSDLKSGIYLAEIKSDFGIERYKLIIRR